MLLSLIHRLTDAATKSKYTCSSATSLPSHWILLLS